MKRNIQGAGVSRRNFLGLAGLSVTAVALSGTLSACGSGGAGNAGAAASEAVKLPSYKEFAGITPDLPGNAKGLQAGFLKMPHPIASVKAKPLTGSITALTETFQTMSPSMGDNPYWQRLNTALGGTLNLQIAQDIGDGYPAQFATTLAGGSLPDLMWIPPNQNLPNVGQMLEAKFQDLTKYLSGDAVLEYPNLAALKPDSWRTAVVNGKIWGAPIPSTPFGQTMQGNKATWAKVDGLNAKDAAEFFDKVKELTRPNQNQYALEPAYINMLHMFTEWLGAPNGWAVNKDRSLTHLYETDQYAAGLEYAAKLFAAGVFYPDDQVPDVNNRVVNGSIAAQVTSGPHNVSDYRLLDPNVQAEVLIPFSFDGKVTPTYDMGYGTVGYTAFKQADEKQIREQLALINYLSAPFGTAEYLQKNYGTEGQDFTFDSNGNPVLTKSGNTNLPGVVSALTIMSSPENVIFNAAFPEDTKYVSAQEQKLLVNAWRNPTNGTYSDTNAKVGAKISTNMTDKVTDIITGRAKIGDLKAAVTRWQNDGGNKIRDEYEAQLNPDAPVFKL